MAGIDQYTKLLLHCNGADASTTFIDSAMGKAVTAVGNAQIDTAQSKFGGASGLFDGSGDYLTVVDSTDWAFGTGNLTIDFWVRFAGASVQMCVFFGQGTSINDRFYCYWEANIIVVYHLTAGIGTTIYNKSWTPSVNTWYHVAIVRNGNNWDIYINGASLGTVSTSITINDLAAVFVIGKNDQASSYYINGWLDEIRISKGIARWTGNFTPPTSAYIRGGNALPFFM